MADSSDVERNPLDIIRGKIYLLEGTFVKYVPDLESLGVSRDIATEIARLIQCQMDAMTPKVNESLEGPDKGYFTDIIG